MTVSTSKLSISLLILIPLCLLISFNGEMVAFLFSRWLNFDHGAYNHGLLLLGICIFFFGKKLPESVAKHNKYISGLLLVVASILVVAAFAANVVHVVTLQIAILYTLLWVLALLFLGWRGLLKWFQPLTLLVFALPIWGWLSVYLQKATLEVAYFLVYATGIPVVKESFLITIPPGRFEVEPSCSGLSYFIAASALAIIYSMLIHRTTKQHALVIGCIIFASIVANWLRVYIVIMAGNFSNMQHSLVSDHFNLGWMLFAVFFMALVYFFNKRFYIQSSSGIGDTKDSSVITPIPKLSILSSIGICLVIVSLFASKEILSKSPTNFIPDIVVNSHDSDLKLVDGFGVILGQTFTGAKERYFTLSDREEDAIFYEARFPSQNQGRELVHGNNIFYNEAEWISTHAESLNVDTGSIERVHLRSKSSGQNVIVFHWYYVDGTRTTSGIQAKLYELMAYLKGNRNIAAYMALVKDKDAADRWLAQLRLNNKNS